MFLWFFGCSVQVFVLLLFLFLFSVWGFDFCFGLGLHWIGYLLRISGLGVNLIAFGVLWISAILGFVLLI